MSRRSAEERAAARKLGVDRYGRPTTRSLGISPRQLRAANPDLAADAAARMSHALRVAALRSWGAGRSPDTRGVPAEFGRVTEGEPAQPVDSDEISGHGLQPEI